MNQHEHVQPPPISLKTILKSSNLVEELPETFLRWLGNEVTENFIADDQTREPWLRRNSEALNLVMQLVENKTFPFPGAANIKFPIITVAALQFMSRIAARIFPDGRPVGFSTLGLDFPEGPALARQAADRLNQALFAIPDTEASVNWFDEMDRTLLVQAVLGTAFKKTWYDSTARSLCSAWVSPEDLVVDYYTRTLEGAGRITQVLRLTPMSVRERVIRGVYTDQAYTEGTVQTTPASAAYRHVTDRIQGRFRSSENRPQESPKPSGDLLFLEHYCRLDLDGDGYAEPYIVTVHLNTRQVARVVANFFESSVERFRGEIARITPEQYFTKFGFIPAPDGGFYDVGFGQLLGPANEAVNSILNQTMDSGTLSNSVQGFLSREVRIKGGRIKFQLGEWVRTEATAEQLHNGVYPFPIKDIPPSSFDLLTLLINYAERIGISVDSLVGELPGQNTPAETSRNAIEQGQMVFSMLYKRTWRALASEFRKMARLMALYGSAMERALFQQLEDANILPAADPRLASDALQVQQLGMVAQRADAHPDLYDRYLVERKILDAMRLSDVDTILPPPGTEKVTPPLPPDPRAIKAQADAQVAQQKLILEAQRLELEKSAKMAELAIESEVASAEVTEKNAKALEALQNAKAEEKYALAAVVNADLSAQNQRHRQTMDALGLLQDVAKLEQEAKQQDKKEEGDSD